MSEVSNRDRSRAQSSQRIASWLLALALLAGSIPRGAFAQGQQQDLTKLSLEELSKIEVETVYGASKFLQKVTEAPASVTIITADEIQKFGYRTLADVLKAVRGFYVIYDRNYSYVGVRGFARPGDYNTRILLLVDGHRLNDGIYDQALIGTEFPIDLELIERVEVIRGPSSSLYGTNAFLGVVNIVTKKIADAKGAEVSLEAGSFDTYRTRFTYAAELPKRVGLLLSGSLYSSHGPRSLYFPEFDSPATNNGIAKSADGDRYQRVFVELTVRNLRIEGVLGTRTKRIPTASFGTVFNDARNRTTDIRGYLDVQYERRFGDKWDFLTHFFFDRYNYEGNYVYDYAGNGIPPYVENKDFGHSGWWGFTADASRTFFSKHRVTFGVDFRGELWQNQGNFDAAPYAAYLYDRRTAHNVAFDAEDSYAIRKNLTLSAGLRFDHYSTFGGTVNPRLALIYSPWERTTVKFLYGRAFRAPNVYEMFYQTAGTNKPNPTLGPEKIHATELILEHYFNKHFRLSASAYLSRLVNELEQKQDPADGLLVFTNDNKEHGKGLELELEGKWSSGWLGRLSYSLQDAREVSDGDPLTSSPRHIAKANFVIPIVKKKLFTGLEGQFTSRRRTAADTELGSYFLANVTLFGARIFKGLDVSASLYNLFDKRYAESGSNDHREKSLAQDGRTFRVALTYRF